ncbi:MAG: 50S ribosomal protein L16 [Candidatus Woesearchaeota archaeon]
MAKIRKGVSYRRLERPYTRISKFREKSYIKASPHIAIAKFDVGDNEHKFSHRLDLVLRKDLQLRHNTLESARQTTNRLLEKKLGKNGYHLKLRVFPHHILRENPLASGAGADRMSTGMSKSFGKIIGKAARCFSGQAIMSAYVDENGLDIAKKALKRAQYKVPCACSIVFNKNTVHKK